MKTKYASYLMGKAAGTAMLFPMTSVSQSRFSLSEIFSSDLHIIQQETTGIELKSAFSESSSYGGTGTAAEISVYESNCTQQTPSTMNVVVTGIKPGEHIYLGYSTSLASKGTWGSDLYDLRLPPSSLRILAHVQYGISSEFSDAASPMSSSGAISIPVDLNQLDINPGSQFYLQAVTETSSNTYRISELDKVSVVSESCTSNSNYGETSGCYGGSASCY